MEHRAPVPDRVPGELVQDPELLLQVQEHLSTLCGLNALRSVRFHSGRGDACADLCAVPKVEHLAMCLCYGGDRFPGSQPVSFDLQSLKMLEEEDFWVCEKSDGVRVIVLVVATEQGQQTYLVDRKYYFYQVSGLRFPHQTGLDFDHSNTVLDGELVIDVEPARGEVLRLLLFDCLVIDSENLMHKPLHKRYGVRHLPDSSLYFVAMVEVLTYAYIMEPYDKLLMAHPEAREYLPFEVRLKPQELSYGIEAVFREHVPKLLHGNDGLIFTSAEAVYTPGTDPKMWARFLRDAPSLKWKPPSENSIDFVLQLKFPARGDNDHEPDYTAKPIFMLLMNHGHEGSFYFDTMSVDDDTWEKWKASGEQYDDRVVEVVWDVERQTWRLLRFRDDKLEGNYKTVVSSIIKSIQHGVEEERLVGHAPRIKSAWKVRAERRRREEEERRRVEEERRRVEEERRKAEFEVKKKEFERKRARGEIPPQGQSLPNTVAGGLRR
ncbi:BZ3500_MvSof-1268-A1-R1_Chr6-3g08735 [Microbotryum saponariae]|uniref:mRNA guanylyltransferase n=1 Tax=Microbotryum saponariae TaxID=289078 RepID=A0A2X0NMF0_9BASI|nr:BZ3500_MvSof-1268-A1-R1_Chr6-3g08735 [Microbotryum saponariae]SDA07336.1 BZ3501_MvSof-1269-A2-R1_Chr6-2g08438 [Microbotryum saponariae]